MKTLPNITHDFPQWYQAVVDQAELAEHSPVRGCMVIKPYGCALWEKVKSILDKKIKDTGHENAIFPLLIPQSYLAKEAEHVDGFAPELAIVTHAGGKKLEDPLVVRPTSETMIHAMFAQWIRSWRDLPIKINQWANVVRWEMRPRPFLRTSEFFWQEGHTAHAGKQEAQEETDIVLEQYRSLIEEHLAVPMIVGEKTPHERFPGAEKTITIESVMPDGKALQMGTVHVLSQGFARSFDMKYQSQDGSLEYPYLTSWGVTTRLLGALLMTHGDQKGLVMPPRVAPVQCVIIPIFRSDEQKHSVLKQVRMLQEQLSGVRIVVDDDDKKTPGAKFYQWELKGVPLRIEIGPRDLESSSVVVTNRLTGEKNSVAWEGLSSYVAEALETMQRQLFAHAKNRAEQLCHEGTTVATFGDDMAKHGGMYRVGWCGSFECEKKLKVFQGSIRCIVNGTASNASCFGCETAAQSVVYVAKSY